MTSILVFGDSITWGAWDKRGGWVCRLKEYLSPDILIYNFGVSGDTTEDLLKRLECELNSIRDEKVVLFQIGINDSSMLNGKNKVSADEFERNLNEIIKITRKFTDKILFVGLTPVNENRTAPVEWDENLFYKNEFVEKYNEILEEVAFHNDIPFVSLLDKLDEKMLEDGLHPNSDGHEIIFREVVRNLNTFIKL